MRLASYNVENLFERAKVMNLDSWSEGKPILSDYAKFNTLIAKDVYSTADKAAMLNILEKYKMLKAPGSTYFVLRENRGRLMKKETASVDAEIVATGRAGWIGWLELKKEPVKAVAITNTARVIKDINADVLGVVEAEDRLGLKHFNKLVLASTEIGAEEYRHVMLIDGNDERGIDVAIMSKEGFPIESIQSHADERAKNGKPLFSRDCATYQIKTPKGNTLWVLVNHLKSKGYGSAAESNAKRQAQAKRIREIYDAIVETHPLVAVIGDLNDTPDSVPLAPLCGSGSPLKDISENLNFDDGGRPGTYANGTKSNKIDYILCSPALMATMTEGGIWRMGVWGGTHGTLFPHYDTIKDKSDAASDHAAIWADFDI